MADVLLDTCVVLWAGLEPGRLTRAAAELVTAPDARVFVSSITAAEVACAQERGRITLRDHWKRWLRRALDVNGWEALPASLEVVEEAYSLPEPFHRDPADRLIAATARVHRLTLLTGDRLLLDYPHVDTVW